MTFFFFPSIFLEFSIPVYSPIEVKCYYRKHQTKKTLWTHADFIYFLFPMCVGSHALYGCVHIDCRLGSQRDIINLRYNVVALV